jgi:chemotaxis protein MotB
MAFVRPGGEGDNRAAHKVMAEEIEEKLDGQAFAFDVNMDYLKFSVPERLLFDEGAVVLAPRATKVLSRIGEIVKSHGGYLRVYGFSAEDPRSGGRFQADFENSLARAVSVMNHLVERHYIGEDYASARGASSVQNDTAVRTPAARTEDRRIDFVLSVEALKRD